MVGDAPACHPPVCQILLAEANNGKQWQTVANSGEQSLSIILLLPVTHKPLQEEHSLRISKDRLLWVAMTRHDTT